VVRRTAAAFRCSAVHTGQSGHQASTTAISSIRRASESTHRHLRAVPSGTSAGVTWRWPVQGPGATTWARTARGSGMAAAARITTPGGPLRGRWLTKVAWLRDSRACRTQPLEVAICPTIVTPRFHVDRPRCGAKNMDCCGTTDRRRNNHVSVGISMRSIMCFDNDPHRAAGDPHVQPTAPVRSRSPCGLPAL
jgi:hypothetical protein